MRSVRQIFCLSCVVFCVWVNTGLAQWQFLGPPVDTATVYGICMSPLMAGKVYLANADTDGYIYKSINMGQTWVRLDSTRGWCVDQMAHGEIPGKVFALNSG